MTPPPNFTLTANDFVLALTQPTALANDQSNYDDSGHPRILTFIFSKHSCE
jgi:hypothetical protein